MEKIKELKLLISAKDNLIETKGYFTNLNRLELIGIYEFLRNEGDKGMSDGIALHVKIEKDKMIKEEIIHNGSIPVSLIYNRLKQEIMKNINLKLNLHKTW